ncbi:MAG: hypothetical protein ABIJ57_16255 [Pseudomonadota bacterium]|nr:hypothetical protein [Pseudomonadota bacterium]
MKWNSPRQNDREELLVFLALCVLVRACYWPVRDFGFVNYDNALYVTENLRVQAGLTMEGLSLASARGERRKKGLDHTTR